MIFSHHITAQLFCCCRRTRGALLVAVVLRRDVIGLETGVIILSLEERLRGVMICGLLGGLLIGLSTGVIIISLEERLRE